MRPGATVFTPTPVTSNSGLTLTRATETPRQKQPLDEEAFIVVAWGLQRRTDTRGHAVFERLCHGQRTRRKQAAVALARKILIWCWAILRDGSVWDETRVSGRLAVT